MLATLWAAGAVGCAPLVSLDDRPCPCLSGYHCCAAIDTCLPDAQACPGTGGAPPSDPLSGAGAASGGAAGAPAGVAPSWRSIYPGHIPFDHDDLYGYAFELGPTGTPYIALDACTVCDPARPGAPYVMRWSAGAWSGLPSDGLETVGGPMALSVGVSPAGDRPQLLFAMTEQALRSFEGNTWVARPPPVAQLLIPVNFERSDAGDLYTTTRDVLLLSLARFDGVSWTVIGPGVKAESARMAVSGDRVWLGLTSTLLADSTTQIWVYTGAEPVLERQFEHYDLFSIAAARDGTLYVALRDVAAAEADLVARAPDGTWASLGSFPTTDLELRVASDGALYAAYAVYNGNVYVVRWDGQNFIDLDSEAIDARSGRDVQLRIAGEGDTRVPYVSYWSDSGELKVWEYSRH